MVLIINVILCSKIGLYTIGILLQGGSEILESLGYTEYTGFALQYPRNIIPDFFADHIGNLTVELVLAAVEISSLIVHFPPNLETLHVLQEAEAFPGNEPEGISIWFIMKR